MSDNLKKLEEKADPLVARLAAKLVASPYTVPIIGVSILGLVIFLALK